MGPHNLGNVEDLHSQFPNFYIHSRVERESLVSGDHVKLIFVSTPERREGDMLWVTISRSDADHYYGLLNSLPGDQHSNLVIGKLIVFGPEHVLDWIRPRPPPPAPFFEALWLYAQKWLRKPDNCNEPDTVARQLPGAEITCRSRSQSAVGCHPVEYRTQT